MGFRTAQYFQQPGIQQEIVWTVLVSPWNMLPKHSNFQGRDEQDPTTEPFSSHSTLLAEFSNFWTSTAFSPIHFQVQG